jgi:hypothetical protein
MHITFMRKFTAFIYLIGLIYIQFTGVTKELVNGSLGLVLSS